MTTISIQKFIGDEPFETPMIDCFHDWEDFLFMKRNLVRKMTEQQSGFKWEDQQAGFSVRIKVWDNQVSEFVETGWSKTLNFEI